VDKKKGLPKTADFKCVVADKAATNAAAAWQGDWQGDLRHVQEQGRAGAQGADGRVVCWFSRALFFPLRPSIKETPPSRARAFLL